MGDLLETVCAYLNTSHQSTVSCVHCRAKTSLTMAHHQPISAAKLYKPAARPVANFFCVIFESRRHHRTQSVSRHTVSVPWPRRTGYDYGHLALSVRDQLHHHTA